MTMPTVLAGCAQLLVAAITLLNNLVSDEDVRLTVINQLSTQKGKHLQVNTSNFGAVA